MAEVTLENAPRKARELFEKGFAALERGNLDYSMDMLLASLEIEPKLLQARKFLRAAEVKKFKDKGGSHLVSTISHFLTLMSARSAIKKKPEQALKTAEKLMRADPLNLSFVNVLGQAAVAAGMPEVAIQALEIARDHYPQDGNLLKWLGNLYLSLNRTHEGRLCFEDLLKLRPNDPKALKMLKDSAALDTMKQGGWNEAESYRDVIKDTKGSVLLEQESKAVKSTKDMQDLIRSTLLKVQREPDNVNYKRALADLYVRVEQFDDALNLLKEAQESSGRADPQIDRAVSAIRVKQFDQEVAALRQAGNETAAKAKEAEKDKFLLDDAVDRVKRYPNDLQFKYELGVLFVERGRLNEAIQEFQQSQRNPQRRIRSLYYLALCFKQKQQYDIAMEQLEKAASELNVMDDTKKDIVYEMGLICRLTGDRAKAAHLFKEIYSVDIGFKDVAKRVEEDYGTSPAADT